MLDVSAIEVREDAKILKYLYSQYFTDNNPEAEKYYEKEKENSYQEFEQKFQEFAGKSFLEIKKIPPSEKDVKEIEKILDYDTKEILFSKAKNIDQIVSKIKSSYVYGINYLCFFLCCKGISDKKLCE